MTNQMDPHVKAMLEAATDVQRSEILLSAPVFTLMRWREVFHKACRRAAFDEGVVYLDAWHEALAATRDRGGFRGTALGSAQMPLLYQIDNGRAPGGGE